MNKRKSMSRYAFLLLGIVIMSEPVLSYGYTIKQPIEFELSAYGNILEVAGSCPAGTGFMEGLFCR